MYHWLPCEITVRADDARTAHIRSAIHPSCLRGPDTEELYAGLEKVFQAMVPMWTEAYVLPNGLRFDDYRSLVQDGMLNWREKPTTFPNALADVVLSYLDFDWIKDVTLQVVVKAQEYNMNTGSSYAGKWHMEGT